MSRATIMLVPQDPWQIKGFYLYTNFFLQQLQIFLTRQPTIYNNRTRDMLTHNSSPYIESSWILCITWVYRVRVLFSPHAMILGIGRWWSLNDDSSEKIIFCLKSSSTSIISKADMANSNLLPASPGRNS